MKGVATKIPFKNSHFDAAHCSHVIEHMYPENAHIMLTEIDRVIKPGGIICIRSPLMHSGFYNDFTHIKPYNPEAIMHYLNDEDIEQSTLAQIKSKYSLVKLRYRRNRLFTELPIVGVLFRERYGIRILGAERTGYMLIMKKLIF